MESKKEYKEHTEISKPKFHNGRPIFQPGETYEINGLAYEVITAITQFLGESEDDIKMTELIFILESVETKERICMSKTELEAVFKN